MAFTLSQFNQQRQENVENTNYLTPLSEGTAARRKVSSANGVEDSSQNIFYDECVFFQKALDIGVNYFFHAKVKKLVTDQVFYLYLVNYSETGNNVDKKTQYLKTVTIPGGGENEWVDLKLVFSPLQNFDCILFQLQRTIDDYGVNRRVPYIVYKELAQINNLATTLLGNDNQSLIKIGIQSRPGMMLCLNGEEIHVGKSGIYEVRNGIVSIDFLSMVFPSEEGDIDGENFDAYLTRIATAAPDPDSTNSACIFGNKKTRTIEAFILDYMYEEA